MELSNLCLSCFSDTAGVNPCPNCGNDRSRMPYNTQHLAPGTILNRSYLVGRVLGQGGFGITYLGYELSSHRVVAIKEYFPMGHVTRRLPTMVLPMDENSRMLLKKGVNLFFKEALILANLSSHPNIVNVLHFFRENNTAYIVMEYVRGQSLKDYLLSRGNSISYTEAQQILCPIMRALADLHRAGLLHRDIAPDNIYLTTTGQAKLLDFGAARFGMAEETMDATSVIKPGYAPLEQYSGRSGQGTWTDVYAMGATFYRALTGNVPIPATDRAMGAVMLSPRELGLSLPDAANAAIMKAMAIKTEQRYAFMTEFEGDIANAVAPVDPTRTRTLQQPVASLPQIPPTPISYQNAAVQSGAQSHTMNPVQPLSGKDGAKAASGPIISPASPAGRNGKPNNSLKRLLIPLIILFILLLIILGSVLINGVERSNIRQTPLTNAQILETVLSESLNNEK